MGDSLSVPASVLGEMGKGIWMFLRVRKMKLKMGPEAPGSREGSSYRGFLFELLLIIGAESGEVPFDSVSN